VKDVPVIVFSADYTLDSARKARDGGARECVVKGTVPWDRLCDLIAGYAAA
jgi:hypothetical protein